MKYLKIIIASCYLFTNQALLPLDKPVPANLITDIAQLKKQVDSLTKLITAQKILPTQPSKSILKTAIRKLSIPLALTCTTHYINAVIIDTQDFSKVPDFSSDKIQSYLKNADTTRINTTKSLSALAATTSEFWDRLHAHMQEKWKSIQKTTPLDEEKTSISSFIPPTINSEVSAEQMKQWEIMHKDSLVIIASTPDATNTDIQDNNDEAHAALVKETTENTEQE